MNTPTDALRALVDRWRIFATTLVPTEARWIVQFTDELSALLRQPSPPSDSALRMAIEEAKAGGCYGDESKTTWGSVAYWIEKRAASIDRASQSAQGGDEGARLRAAIERDRTMFADVVTNMRKTLAGCDWMTVSRGSYEWDDAKYQREFGETVSQIREQLEVLAKRAADWSDSPTTQAEVAAARAAPTSAAPAQPSAGAEAVAWRVEWTSFVGTEECMFYADKRNADERIAMLTKNDPNRRIVLIPLYAHPPTAPSGEVK